MERDFIPDKAVERRTTLAELQGLLATNPDVFGDQLQEIRRAVEDAEAEVEQRGELSQGTAEELDNLYRPFKPEFLK
ncbi:MAG: hypothetical protein A3J46_06545 [Candidatus Yanofskybacteria bacterium RIFCSPHIGHO2_02_FULL_41_11]|uniref:Uncharacterized protein n=1 Tax=Candidatus Yanofskybacteria bacterium RIFCSPHIGHO2_02_FULL_41_11 TaxID=1802675 RepID=A0A1F8F6E0_9BACT|nr:MAG: hypothetical protein A3J46_06545 [Candidatus Yanofskybacteria bacterium RIFCSPHIGHO2_02_FULL_41_11]